MKKFMYTKILVLLLLVGFLTGCTKEHSFVEEYKKFQKENKEEVLGDVGDTVEVISAKSLTLNGDKCYRDAVEEYERVFGFFSLLGIDFRYTKICMKICFENLDSVYEEMKFLFETDEGCQEIEIIGIESGSEYWITIEGKEWFQLNEVTVKKGKCELSNAKDFDWRIKKVSVNKLRILGKKEMLVYNQSGEVVGVIRAKNLLQKQIVRTDADYYRIVRR